MTLSNNIVIVTYAESRHPVFAIQHEHGTLKLEDLKFYCDEFFKSIFPQAPINSKIIATIGKHTQIEVELPIGVKRLDWSWHSVFS